MEGIATNSRLIPFVTRCGFLNEHPLRLIDVGCSGGLDAGWRQFEKDLVAFGFDPNVIECERLQQQEDNPRVQYIPAFVGLPKEHPFMVSRAGIGPSGNNPWNRLSTAEVLDRMRANS